MITAVLVGLYLLRVLFRFLSNYLAHKAAWFLVGDLRTKTYDKLERMHLGYFHDKQTGDLMSRVAIARAIMRQSPIIILDEATASVDVETERQIQQAIAGIAGTRTIVSIAHRLFTIRNADQILVIENGRITERGTHAELVALGGSYARMNSIQTAAAGGIV